MPPSHEPERRSQPPRARRPEECGHPGWRQYRDSPASSATSIPAASDSNVAAEAGLPGRFLLHVPSDGVAYRIAVCWRKSERVGVGFKSSEPWQE